MPVPAASERKRPFINVTIVPACIPCPVQIAEPDVQDTAITRNEIIVVAAYFRRSTHEHRDLVPGQLRHFLRQHGQLQAPRILRSSRVFRSFSASRARFSASAAFARSSDSRTSAFCSRRFSSKLRNPYSTDRNTIPYRMYAHVVFHHGGMTVTRSESHRRHSTRRRCSMRGRAGRSRHHRDS